MSTRAEAPHRGLWRTEVVRAVLSGHSSLGIAFAAAIYIVCLTGTLCVFQRDWQRWEQPDAPALQTVSDAALARAVTAFGAHPGSAEGFYVSLPNADLPRLVLSTGRDADDETWIADADGRLAVKAASPWADFLAKLHTSLFVPGVYGPFLVGLAGVALLSSLISGVLAHPRVFRDAFHLRLGGSRRLEQADLHNRLGVWALPFHVLVSLTGALLGLSALIVGALALLLFRGDTAQVYRLLSTPPPAEDARPAALPDVAALIAAVRARSPGAEPNQITVTHWGRRDLRIGISAARPGLIGDQDNLTFDAAGRIVAEKHLADQNVGTEILGALGPLHFGWFGGGAIRIIYGLLGLALCIVTVSGINVWLARRRDKGRAVPTIERVWAAVVWGQPLILSSIALIVVLARGSAEAATLGRMWTVATFTLPLLAAIAKSLARERIAVLLQGATAIVLIGAALISAALRPVALDSSAVWITLVLSSGGLALGLLMRRQGRQLT